MGRSDYKYASWLHQPCVGGDDGWLDDSALPKGWLLNSCGALILRKYTFFDSAHPQKSALIYLKENIPNIFPYMRSSKKKGIQF